MNQVKPGKQAWDSVGRNSASDLRGPEEATGQVEAANCQGTFISTELSAAVRLGGQFVKTDMVVLSSWPLTDGAGPEGKGQSRCGAYIPALDKPLCGLNSWVTQEWPLK